MTNTRGFDSHVEVDSQATTVSLAISGYLRRDCLFFQATRKVGQPLWLHYTLPVDISDSRCWRTISPREACGAPAPRGCHVLDFCNTD